MSRRLSAQDIIEYMHQNFTRADGLWFVMVEKRFGFDMALEIDKEVWEVLPKMQARFLRQKLGLDDGWDSFALALKNKLRLDGFLFQAVKKGPSLTVCISRCPWHETMKRSKRTGLSQKVGSVICPTEYSAFSKEFAVQSRLQFSKRICRLQDQCVMVFQETGKGPS